MTKTLQSLVPVLLLATVALSSSNVLPMLAIETESVGSNRHQNDNIFYSKDKPSNLLNDILYTISIATPQDDRRRLQYVNSDNKSPGSGTFIKRDVYNGEGFRKEQWHNYPRQLDRLHRNPFDHTSVDKRNPDPDDPNSTEEILQTSPDDELKSNEFKVMTNDENGYETVVAASNPFLIFKIRLACLKDKLKNTNEDYKDAINTSEPEYILDDKEMYKDMVDPEVDVVKVKREEVNEFHDSTQENSMTKNRAVKKRIFSLWSRLQSLNHKGHELQHRRHLHAFYGLPDGEGGGVLTAETRATFMRPPGSPLRWG